jgi:hypothetical protein
MNDPKLDADELVRQWRAANPVAPKSNWELSREWRRNTTIEHLDQEDISTLREWGII